MKWAVLPFLPIGFIYFLNQGCLQSSKNLQKFSQVEIPKLRTASPSSHQNQIERYRVAVSKNQKNANAFFNLGVAYRKLNRYDEAIASFKEAIRLKPDYAEAYGSLGFVHFNLNHYDEAIASYEETIRINPEFTQVYNNLGIVYHNLKRYNEAITNYKNAVRIKPSFAQAHFNLGLIFDVLEDGATAKLYMIKAKKLYKEQGNERYAKYASINLKRYFTKYGVNPILPVDYTESDKDLNEVWFKFTKSLSLKKDHAYNVGCILLLKTLGPLYNYQLMMDYIIMRSGRFLLNVAIEKRQSWLVEFLGLEVEPHNALVAYSGIKGPNFSERLTFELNQHVRRLTIKFTDRTNKVKSCELELAETLQKKLINMQRYEKTRANVNHSTR